MKIVVVIQARTASTRLPGKVLAPICGRPLLSLMLDRVRAACEPDDVIVATTLDPSDDAIVRLCQASEAPYYRGSLEDCLDRHVQAATARDADAVVKIPSDCPLIAPSVIDAVLSAYRHNAATYDYVSNLHPASWPDGNDVEVMSMGALHYAAAQARDAFDREHTTPFLWSRPERFRLGNVLWRKSADHARRFRWVVDWAEDLTLVRELFERLLPVHGPVFEVEEILALIERAPELEHINAAHRGYDYAQGRREQRPLIQPTSFETTETPQTPSTPTTH